ncbi:HAD family hydrolase [Lysobacter enzymogenes]|uniref:HAD family hydrolase n=1 Tax=Lysobacter enzymogenes TaxID=69 RepID=UPI0022647814|nr:HAD hydrolase-like protein [Lysobacter enzymogenes]UZW62844.1 HAD hydrolase-like protein [Lysobacter enzymogenes]
MIELLLFDLDNTLLRTTDLDPFRGPAGLNPAPGYQRALEQTARGIPGREVYSPGFLRGLRATHPNLKIGIFTRAPRAYVSTLLGIYYPGFDWDAVVAREDVTNTKPDPEGIYLAAKPFNIMHGWQVALVGDEVADVKAAYRAGIWAVVDMTTWPNPLANTNYWVKERLPDALIEGPDELAGFLRDPQAFQPLFDQWVQRGGPLPAGVTKRVETINHFDKTPERRAHVKISLLGRRFSEHPEYESRRSWHPASSEIENHKESLTFPPHWVGALRDFIRMRAIDLPGLRHTVTVIPAKPGRPHV